MIFDENKFFRLTRTIFTKMK